MATDIASVAEEHPFYIVDAFTRRRHRGNSAAVVLLPAAPAATSSPSEAELQSLAAEFNLSETAFVWLLPQGGGGEKEPQPLRLRWFTPECEVALCGHATLAAATAVFRHFGGQQPAGGGDRLIFDTLSGQLPVARDPSSGQWSLDFPLATVETIALGDRDASQQLLEAVLGPRLAAPAADAVAALSHSPDRQKLLVELRPARRRDFLRLRPNFAAMLAAAPSGRHIRGVVVTMRDGGPDVGGAEEADAIVDAAEADMAADAADAGLSAGVDGGRRFDFLSRYFAPWVGIPEDPVTGAAHTVLAAYWGRGSGGRLLARQCSRRGGVVGLTVDTEKARVALTGHSVVSARGWVPV